MSLSLYTEKVAGTCTQFVKLEGYFLSLASRKKASNKPFTSMSPNKVSQSQSYISIEELTALQLRVFDKIGGEFFIAIAKELNTISGSDITVIALLNRSGLNLKILAVSGYNDSKENLYPFLKAVNDNIIDQKLKSVHFNPSLHDKFSLEHHINECIGVTFNDNQGEPLGVILLLQKQKTQNLLSIKQALETIVPRVSIETERFLIEKELKAKHTRFEFALNTINLGVYEWNITHDIGVFNQRLYDILEQIEGQFDTSFKNWLTIVHPDDYDKLAIPVHQNFENEKKVYNPVRYRIRAKSGVYKWVEVQSYSYTDDTDNTRRNVGTIKDIDAEIRAEKILNEIQEREIQLHNQIAQREKLYAFALKVGNLGVYNWHVQEERAVMSPKLAEILGREVKEFEISFSEWLSLIHPDDQWQFSWKSYHQQAIHNPHTLHIYRIRNIHDEYRWIETQNMVAEKDGQGLIVRMVGIVRDLNEEKKSNDELLQSFEKQKELNERIKKQAKKLSESESRWAYALEGHGDGVVEWNIQTGECVFSSQAQKILGFPLNTRDDINKFMEHVHPDMRQEFSGYFQLSLKPPFNPFQMDVQILDDRNNYNWVMFRGKVIELTSEGSPLRMVGTVSDVSAQKIFQKEFTIYEEMIKQNQSAILFLSMSGTIEFVNNTTTEWLGYRKHEILEKNISFLLLNISVETILVENYRGVQQLLTKSGNTLLAQVATSMLRLEGETIGYVLNLIDITEKKQLEEELTLLKVAKLEAELQSQRRQTEMIIQAQENEKGSIARELHDGVGQLLSLAKLQLAQLTLNSDSANQKKHKALEDLIQQITTDVKGLTSELMPLTLRNLGLESAVSSLLEHYNKLKGEDVAITCKINLDGYEPDATISIHIYRIAQEALNNMMKYSNATTMSVMLMKLKNSINLMIEDNGKGFDVQNQLKKNNSFGLKTMNERAKLINGKLLINSTPNAGTTISLTVPIIIQ